MEGITIIENTEKIIYSIGYWWIGLIIGTVILCVTISAVKDTEVFGVCLILAVLFTATMSAMFSFVGRKPVAKEYDIQVEDTVSFNDVMSKYEIQKNKGNNIYTVRTKTMS